MPLLLLFDNPNFGVVELVYEEFSNRLKKGTEGTLNFEGAPVVARNTITVFDPRRYAPVPSGGTLLYKGLLADEDGNPQVAADLSLFTLTITDTATGNIINGVNGENLLTGSRMTFDENGLFRISIASTETLVFAPATKNLRSLVFEWRYADPELVGRHQADFMVVRLAGD